MRVGRRLLAVLFYSSAQLTMNDDDDSDGGGYDDNRWHLLHPLNPFHHLSDFDSQHLTLHPLTAITWTSARTTCFDGRHPPMLQTPPHLSRGIPSGTVPFQTSYFPLVSFFKMQDRGVHSQTSITSDTQSA